MNNTIDNSLSGYHDQIEALERAAANRPGSCAYDAALERQFADMKEQVRGSNAGRDASCNHHSHHHHSHHNQHHHTHRNQHHYTHHNQHTQHSHLSRHHQTQQHGGASTAPAPSGFSPSPSIGGAGPLNTANLPQALKQYAPMIDAASRATGVSPNIIAAQLWQESGGDAGATSTNPGNGKTDVGLMQINPDTFADLQRKHPELQGKSPSNPATNILAAAYLMSDNLKQYHGNVNLALRAYNSGSVDPLNANIAPGGVGDPNYVRSVDAIMSNLNAGQALSA